MKAIKRFTNTMERCRSLVELASSNHGNDDCLRMAIVLAVSALEKYVKDCFLEALARHCRKEGGNFNAALNERLQKAGIDTLFWTRKALGIGPTRPLKVVRNKMARHLNSFPVQTAASIDELFLCYDLKNITTHAAEKTKWKKVKTSIKSMILRRHAIAHGSDYCLAGKLQPIDCNEFEYRLGRLTRFVEAMDEIVKAKLSKRKKQSRRKQSRSRTRKVK